MALPENNVDWPLKHMSGVTERIAMWSDWHAGDPHVTGMAAAPVRRWEGIVPAVRRLVSGDPVQDNVDVERLVHLPVPAKIARKSSVLLFGEPVAISVKDDKNTKGAERLALITGPELNSTLISAGETCAALGGVYFRASWTPGVKNVFITRVDADLAVPSFHYDRLQSVQFWTTVHSEGTIVWRYVEEHSLDALGIGIITHALFEGTASNLGHEVSLLERPETAGLVPLVDENNVVSTKTPGLGAVYVPNVTPSAAWRTHPVGKSLGKSDYEGIEPMFGAINRVNGYLMREFDMGKSRLLVSDDLLEDLGAGKGVGFDIAGNGILPMNSRTGSLENAKGMPVEKVQFEIRVEQHLAFIEYLEKYIITAAGYSAATYGKDDGTRAAQTATEVTSQDNATNMTRDAKAAHFKYGLDTILSKALATDAALFNTGVIDTDVVVTFSSLAKADPAAVSTQNAQDAASGSASTITRVKRANPSMSDQEIKDEVALILAEQASQNGSGGVPVASQAVSE